MATNILENQSDKDKLVLELNNGDLKVLNEIIESWKFRDSPSAIRFALAVLKMTPPGELSNKEQTLIPAKELIKPLEVHGI